MYAPHGLMAMRCFFECLRNSGAAGYSLEQEDVGELLFLNPVNRIAVGSSVVRCPDLWFQFFKPAGKEASSTAGKIIRI